MSTQTQFMSAQGTRRKQLISSTIIEDDMDFTKTKSKSKAKKFKHKERKRVLSDKALNDNEEKVHHDEKWNANEEKVIILRKKKVSNLASLNIPGDDDLYNCEECNSVYMHECPKHPLFPVKDAKVPPKCKRGLHSGYCWATLPPGLSIRKSKIPHAGLGVFATQFFPARTRFGPYDGKKQTNEDGYSFGYSWNILKDGKVSHFVDGRDPKDSNWMRFVNCARHDHEQNTTAYQYQGEIYYRSHKDIHPGTEILVFYGERYAKDLGIKTQVVDTKCDRNSSPKAKKKYCSTGNDPTPQNGDVCHSSKTEGSPTIPRRINSRELPRKCDVYGKAFKRRRKLSKHKKTLSGLKPFKCDLCGKTFIWMRELSKHKKTHLGLKPFKCDLCGKTFIRRSELRQHIAHHIGIESHRCETCGKAFKIRRSLRKHQKIHLKLKPFKCDLCGKAFVRKSKLRQHVAMHTGIKSHKCKTCCVSFKRKDHLQRHRRRHLELKCDLCGKTFIRKSELRHHIAHHIGIEPHQCETCGVIFKTRCIFRQHQKIHLGLKPHKCDLCGKAFVRKSKLRQHVAMHTGIKSHKCETCGVTFKRKDHLQRHRRTHSGLKSFLCEVCGKTFGRQSDLREHVVIHSGLKSFVCVCGEAFKRRRELIVHQRRHSACSPKE